jgi:hypothetical protein
MREYPSERCPFERVDAVDKWKAEEKKESVRGEV